MLSMLKEALEWLNRAEEAREVAEQLTDPGARKAVLELAESFDRLARAAATPAVPPSGIPGAQNSCGSARSRNGCPQAFSPIFCADETFSNPPTPLSLPL